MAAFVTPTVRVVVNHFTVPANTPRATPNAVSVVLGVTELARIEIDVPKGHNGFTGFGLDYGTQRLVPFSDQTDWLVTNDAHLGWDLNVQVTSGLTLRGYNTGQFPHTFEVRFVLNDLGIAVPTLRSVAVPL